MGIYKPKPPPDEVLDIASEWEQREESRLFGLCTTGFPPQAREITRALVRHAQDDCRGMQEIETLDLLLHCDGGDPDAAYQLVRLLGSKCKKLRVFVPGRAKSAATLICLGVDEIWMSETSELGPLDAQIHDPRNPEEFRVSALEQFRAMDYLKRYSFEMLDSYVNLMVALLPAMRFRDMIHQGIDFATQLVTPLYEQVDPLHFGGAFRSLEIAGEYGLRLLEGRAYTDWGRERIQRLVNALTWDYPSHSFVIDRQEASKLGLKVKDLQGKNARAAESIVNTMTVWIGFMPKGEKAKKEK